MTEIEQLPTIDCPRCHQPGWLKDIDDPEFPPLVVHSFFPDSEDVVEWCDLTGYAIPAKLPPGYLTIGRRWRSSHDSPVRGITYRVAWSHERKSRRAGNTDEWLTPPTLLEALGAPDAFDLDPCSAVNQPWATARRHYTIHDDGLAQEWHGRVYCNPPYGSQTGRWLERCAGHGDAIALIFARTETRMFHDHVWDRADAVLFLRGRLTFFNADGSPAKNSAGASSCLVAYGLANVMLLRNAGVRGRLVLLSEKGLRLGEPG